MKGPGLWGAVCEVGQVPRSVRPYCGAMQQAQQQNQDDACQASLHSTQHTARSIMGQPGVFNTKASSQPTKWLDGIGTAVVVDVPVGPACGQAGAWREFCADAISLPLFDES